MIVHVRVHRIAVSLSGHMASRGTVSKKQNILCSSAVQRDGHNSTYPVFSILKNKRIKLWGKFNSLCSKYKGKKSELKILVSSRDAICEKQRYFIELYGAVFDNSY